MQEVRKLGEVLIIKTDFPIRYQVNMYVLDEWVVNMR